MKLATGVVLGLAVAGALYFLQNYVRYRCIYPRQLLAQHFPFELGAFAIKSYDGRSLKLEKIDTFGG